ncbi:MAG: glutamate racemase [Bacteroidales bacterium]|nr:glutamate racemase [Bacteroidales bacterium]MBN2697314.1 glutamate racemase [Bacteroidales bacterium]
MESKKSNPIGLFDSGVGGLTVAHAIHTILPQEQMIYYGDTAHLPYGDKSRDTIIHYALGITDFLLEKRCKVILIACNSASSNAFDEVKEHVGDRAVVLNVIDPVVDYVAGDETIRNVGVIGTKATIHSKTYEKKLAGRNSRIGVSSLATPLLVPMIEEGFVFDDISNAIIRSYLSRRELAEIDTLILGCTHYPIIRNQISRFYNFEVNVPDSSLIVAEQLQQFLGERNLLSEHRKHPDTFFVSEYTPYFEVIANMFFNEKILLEKKSIW